MEKSSPDLSGRVLRNTLRPRRVGTFAGSLDSPDTSGSLEMTEKNLLGMTEKADKRRKDD